MLVLNGSCLHAAFTAFSTYGQALDAVFTLKITQNKFPSVFLANCSSFADINFESVTKAQQFRFEFLVTVFINIFKIITVRRPVCRTEASMKVSIPPKRVALPATKKNLDKAICLPCNRNVKIIDNTYGKWVKSVKPVNSQPGELTHVIDP